MAQLKLNTEELVEWCERHGLNAGEIVAEPPDTNRLTGGTIRYRLRRVVDAEAEPIEFEWAEVVTREEFPTLWMWVVP